MTVSKALKLADQIDGPSPTKTLAAEVRRLAVLAEDRARTSEAFWRGMIDLRAEVQRLRQDIRLATECLNAGYADSEWKEAAEAALVAIKQGDAT